MRSGLPATPRLLWVGGRGGWLAERGVATPRALAGLSLPQRRAATAAERASRPCFSKSLSSRLRPVISMARESAGRAVGKMRGFGEGAGAAWEEGGTHGHLLRAEDRTPAPGGTGDGLRTTPTRSMCRCPAGPVRRLSGSGRLRSESPGCPLGLLSSKVTFLELSLCWL